MALYLDGKPQIENPIFQTFSKRFKTFSRYVAEAMNVEINLEVIWTLQGNEERYNTRRHVVSTISVYSTENHKFQAFRQLKDKVKTIISNSIIPNND